MLIPKYTPGPWRAALYLGGAYYVTDAPLHESRGREIAQVFGTVYGPAGPVTAGENARLIAAAPELLEALQAIAEGCSFPENDVQRAIRDRARAAIAKATQP